MAICAGVAALMSVVRPVQAQVLVQAIGGMTKTAETKPVFAGAIGGKAGPVELGVEVGHFDTITPKSIFDATLAATGGKVDADMPGLPYGFDTSFRYYVQPGDYVSGSGFQFLHCCAPNVTELYAYGSLAPQLLLLSVPEPGTWAMLIVGFGLTGTTLRRRRLLPA